MKPKGKQCYYCGADASSREHVPPKLLFKSFNTSSITVPACDAHNSSKSKADQALVYALLIPLLNSQSQWPLTGNVRTAVREAAPHLHEVKHTAYSAPLISDAPNWGLPEVSYVMSKKLMMNWVRELTAGLIWDARKSRDPAIDWAQAVLFPIDWIDSQGGTPLSKKKVESISIGKHLVQHEFNRLNWHQGWSAYPDPWPSDIYSFRVMVRPAEVAFHHRFYNQFNFYVITSVSPETAACIAGKLLWYNSMKAKVVQP